MLKYVFLCKVWKLYKGQWRAGGETEACPASGQSGASSIIWSGFGKTEIWMKTTQIQPQGHSKPRKNKIRHELKSYHPCQKFKEMRSGGWSFKERL